MVDPRREPDALLSIRLTGPLPQDALEVQDFSLRGLEVRVQYALAAGQELQVKIQHPILAHEVCVYAVTTWCRIEPGQSTPSAGLEFHDSSAEQRKNIRQIQAAKVSHRLVEGGRMVGFLVGPRKNAYALYDENTVKVAIVYQRPGHFESHLLGHRPEASIHVLDVETLPEAIAILLHLDSVPEIVQRDSDTWLPIQPEETPVAAAAATSGVSKRNANSGAMASTEIDPKGDSGDSSSLFTSGAFHQVLFNSEVAGYVAVTSVDDAWSLYDSEWNEVAVLHPEEDRFKITILGGSSHDSVDYLIARSFLGGLALAFNLKGEPELEPPMAEIPGLKAEPEPSALEAAGSQVRIDADKFDFDQPHQKVRDSNMNLVGYMCPAPGLPGVWTIYGEEGEKLAMIAPEEGRFRIAYMGDRPGDSLEYLVARSLAGALAITFELSEPPIIDPN